MSETADLSKFERHVRTLAHDGLWPALHEAEAAIERARACLECLDRLQGMEGINIRDVFFASEKLHAKATELNRRGEKLEAAE